MTDIPSQANNFDPDETRVFTKAQISRTAVYSVAAMNDSDVLTAPARLASRDQTEPVPLDWSPFDPDEMTETLPLLEDRFCDFEEIGSGGFGKVYRAMDRQLNRPVAIKSLLQERASRHRLNKFLSEARLSAQLNHPGIISFFGLRRDREGTLYQVMKFVDGITLRECLACTMLNYIRNEVTASLERKALFARLELFSQLCRTVEYIHNKGVVHGDIKPENVMIDSTEQLYLLDWGTAVMAHGGAADEICGTPGYMSPEYIRTRVMDKGTDIFALGMVLFELVTRNRGVDGDTPEEVLRNISRGKYNEIKHFQKKLRIAPALRAIVRKSIAGDPKVRYASAADLRKDVLAFMHNEETRALPDNTVTAIGRFLSNHRTLTFALVLGGIFLSVLCGGLLFRQEENANRQARVITRNRLYFQQLTEARRNMLENRLASVLGQFRSASAGLAYVLEQPATNARMHTEAIYTGGKLPAGSVYSEFFGTDILLTQPRFWAAPGTPVTAEKQLASDLKPVYPLLMATLLRGSDDGDQVASPDQFLKSYLMKGALVNRIVGIFRNGVAFSLPGMQTQENYADLLREWQINEESWQPEIRWLMPSRDNENEPWTMRCLVPVVGTDGKVLGVLGFVLNWEMLVRQASEATVGEAAQDFPYYRRFIINEMGEVYAERSGRNLTFPQQGLKFPYLRQIFTKEIRNSRQGMIVFHGKNYLLSYSKIPSIHCYYVQMIDVDQLKKE